MGVSHDVVASSKDQSLCDIHYVTKIFGYTIYEMGILMNLIVVLFFFTNFIFCFVFTVALARVHYWSLSLPNTKEAKFQPQSSSRLIFV